MENVSHVGIFCVYTKVLVESVGILETGGLEVYIFLIDPNVVILV